MKKAISILSVIIVLVCLNTSCSKSDSSSPVVSYSKVSISGLTILNYPATKSDGTNWDSGLNGTFPDVYFKVTKSTTTDELFSLAVGSRFENLRVTDLPKGWANSTGAPFLVLSDLSQNIDIDLYDYESVGTDEYIGTSTFVISDYISGNNKYPSSITATNGSISIKLDLIWIK
jgi:hypothetical protein